jgi:hypothetical protein
MRNQHCGRVSFRASACVTKRQRMQPRKVERCECVEVESVDPLTGRFQVWREKRVCYAPTDKLPRVWVAVGGELVG